MNFTQEHIDEIKDQYRLLNNPALNEREHNSKDYRPRPEYQRDYARVLYSSAFRRLQGKMQILGVYPDAYFRNRLTHSLEVAQVANAIGEILAKECKMEDRMYARDEMFVLQAAALAHDIGHPAFGHSGERVLDKIGKTLNPRLRFEGNAQNFRVLRVTEKKDALCKGLNLTKRVLLAINKYLLCENFNEPYRKKFLYTSDYNYLNGIREKCDLKEKRTLDVQIIDIADEIAYAVHDLDDGLALHSFGIDELIYELANYKDEKGRLFENDYGYKRFLEIVDQVKRISFKASSYKTLQEYSQVFRKELTSSLTHEFLNDLTMVKVDEEFARKHGVRAGNWELRLDKLSSLREALSDTIFTCISRNPVIELYERRGRVVVESLFDLYNNDSKLMPPDFRKAFSPEESQERLTMDYISGMMDTFAKAEYEKYFHTSFDKIIIESKNNLRLTNVNIRIEGNRK